MKEISIKRLLILLVVNSIIFVGLGIGSILFQFAFLGWGASENSPDFNLDFALIFQIVVLALLSLKKFKNRINYEMIIIFIFTLFAYLILKIVFGII